MLVTHPSTAGAVPAGVFACPKITTLTVDGATGDRYAVDAIEPEPLPTCIRRIVSGSKECTTYSDRNLALAWAGENDPLEQEPPLRNYNGDRFGGITGVGPSTNKRPR